MKSENITTIIFGILNIITWFSEIDTSVKLVLLGLWIVVSIIIYTHTSWLRLLDKFWKDLVTIVLVVFCFYLINSIDTNLTIVSLILFVTTIGTITLQQDRLIKKEPDIIITDHFENKSLWTLNPWKSDCANFDGNRLVFKGLNAPKGKEVAHRDFKSIFELNESYIISCYANSSEDTTGKLCIWCHDDINDPDEREMGESSNSKEIIPDRQGQTLKLKWTAKKNRNLRLHLRYVPGKGQINVRNIKILKK